MRNKRQKQLVWQDIVPAKNIPKKKVQSRRLRQIFNRFAKLFKLITIHRKATLIISSLVIVGLALLFYFWNSARTDDTNTDISSVDLSIKSPAFSTVLPNGKSINDLGGWNRVSPADSNLVVAYIDKLDDVTVRVSQQPLPDNLQDDTKQELANLAIDFGATEKITVNGNQVYIGTSKDGPQSVILTIDNLLILIKSDSKISDDSWAKYISNLR